MASSLENLTNSFGGKLSILDNSNNWDRWSKQMKVIFRFQEVQEVIEAGITPIAANATEAEQTAHRALKKKDFKTMFFIHRCVDLVNFQKIDNATSSKECWDILDKGHSGNDKLKQVRLTTWKRQFELLQMDENESIAEYFNKITNITNQMKSYGSTVSDGDMVEKVIGTLSSKFDYIIVAIMEAKDVSTMKLEELQCSLESHEQRIDARAKNRTTDQALWAHTLKKGNGNKNKGKDQFKKENSQQENPKNNGDQGESSKYDGNDKGKKFMNKKNIQCYNCQKYGHFASECRNKKVPRQYNNEESEANMAQDDSGSETNALLMMAITSDDYDENGQWKWDNASTGSQSTIPFIFEEDNDGIDPPPVTANIKPKVIHVAEHDEAHVEEHVEAHVEESVEEHVEAHVEGNVETHFRRSDRPTTPERRLLDVDAIPDNLIYNVGDLVHLALFVDMEPLSYASAAKSAVWRKAMEDKIHYIERNNTWNMMSLPANKKPIAVKWVYKVKHLPDGSIAKHKARLVAKGQEDKVLKLNKALYGLKQVPRAWNKRIDDFLQHIGYSKCTVDHGIYIKGKNQNDLSLVCLHVDYLLITGSNKNEIEKIKAQMSEEFDMTDLRKLQYFLGLEFSNTSKGLIVHQKKYVTDVLKRFNMMDCNPANTPMEIKLEIEPDISHSVGIVSRFMQKPKVTHLQAVKRIMMYLQGTFDYGILFPKPTGHKGNLIGFCDSDWCGDQVERKSTMGYVFKLFDSPISWSSKKQTVVALSTCEAEYISACYATCQGVWLLSLLKEMKMYQQDEFELMVDNKSAISLAKNPVAHGRSKHIETKFHYLRNQVTKGKLKLAHCRTEIQVADILTKSLKIERFKDLREMLKVTSLEYLNKRVCWML
ncbi:hypothetical protein TSUD_277890 [Trifolium subterraneum]|uniref:CCHC-type domain-containing protein n=1 Tax=Trifolium subterraneum TaxID=3900 RepID=A0A2Z6NKP3_TRISU|nr:hypothetical protein TSUD_277890 [Trifolium subterraneum]